MSTPVTSLNNYLQSRGELHLLSWVEASSGPSSEAVWTCYCKISDEVKGVGVGSQKASARQAAAKQALEVLKGQ